MQQIETFTSKHEFVAAIDNGGRFFNLFSQANDNIVTKGELAKAAGTWASDQNAFLFLDLATNDFAEMDKHSIVDMLEPDLRERYRQTRPRCLEPSRIDDAGEAGEAVIVEGRLEQHGDKSKFSGFIYVPIMAGNVTTFMMIPIFDQFDVYKILDDEAPNRCGLVAVPLKSTFADGDRIRVGGYLRKLEFEDNEDRTNEFYLEALYFSRLS